MAKQTPRPPISLAPRSWLTRGSRECAFPVCEAGPEIESCCNPCETGGYCNPHRAVMRGPRAATYDELAYELRRFLS